MKPKWNLRFCLALRNTRLKMNGREAQIDEILECAIIRSTSACPPTLGVFGMRTSELIHKTWNDTAEEDKIMPPRQLGPNWTDTQSYFYTWDFSYLLLSKQQQQQQVMRHNMTNQNWTKICTLYNRWTKLTSQEPNGLTKLYYGNLAHNYAIHF